MVGESESVEKADSFANAVAVDTKRDRLLGGMLDYIVDHSSWHQGQQRVSCWGVDSGLGAKCLCCGGWRSPGAHGVHLNYEGKFRADTVKGNLSKAG